MKVNNTMNFNQFSTTGLQLRANEQQYREF